VHPLGPDPGPPLVAQEIAVRVHLPGAEQVETHVAKQRLELVAREIQRAESDLVLPDQPVVRVQLADEELHCRHAGRQAPAQLVQRHETRRQQLKEARIFAAEPVQKLTPLALQQPDLRLDREQSNVGVGHAGADQIRVELVPILQFAAQQQELGVPLRRHPADVLQEAGLGDGRRQVARLCLLGQAERLGHVLRPAVPPVQFLVDGDQRLVIAEQVLAETDPLLVVQERVLDLLQIVQRPLVMVDRLRGPAQFPIAGAHRPQRAHLERPAVEPPGRGQHLLELFQGLDELILLVEEVSDHPVAIGDRAVVADLGKQPAGVFHVGVGLGAAVHLEQAPAHALQHDAFLVLETHPIRNIERFPEMLHRGFVLFAGLVQQPQVALEHALGERVAHLPRHAQGLLVEGLGVIVLVEPVLEISQFFERQHLAAPLLHLHGEYQRLVVGVQRPLQVAHPLAINAQQHVDVGLPPDVLDLFGMEQDVPVVLLGQQVVSQLSVVVGVEPFEVALELLVPDDVAEAECLVGRRAALFVLVGKQVQVADLEEVIRLVAQPAGTVRLVGPLPGQCHGFVVASLHLIPRDGQDRRGEDLGILGAGDLLPPQKSVVIVEVIMKLGDGAGEVAVVRVRPVQPQQEVQRALMLARDIHRQEVDVEEHVLAGPAGDGVFQKFDGARVVGLNAVVRPQRKQVIGVVGVALELFQKVALPPGQAVQLGEHPGEIVITTDVLRLLAHQQMGVLQRLVQAVVAHQEHDLVDVVGIGGRSDTSQSGQAQDRPTECGSQHAEVIHDVLLY